MAIYDYSSGGFPTSPVTDDTLAMKGTTYKYNGSAWEVQTGGTTSFTYTATSGQTAFTGADTGSKTLAYTAASLHVFLNGILLDAADYTATDGTTVTLAVGATTGDELQVVAYGVLVGSGGGGGGWTTITTGTVTGTSTYNLDFTNIPASYNDLRLTIIEGESISSGLSWRYFRMLVGTDSTFATTRTFRSNSTNNIRGAGLTTETNNSYSTSDYGGGGIYMTLIGNGVTKYSAAKIYGSIDFVNVNSDFHYVDSSFNANDSTEIVTHRARSAGWSGGLNNLRFYTGYNTGFIAGTQFLLQGK